MRDAIERVIADLQARRDTCSAIGSYNRADAFEVAVNLLEAVIADDDEQKGFHDSLHNSPYKNINFNRANGNSTHDSGDGQTDQVVSSRRSESEEG